MKERAIILIDGSNFYFKLKDLKLNQILFDFSGFVKLLAKNTHVVSTTYYVGAVKNGPSEKAKKNVCQPATSTCPT